MYAGEDRSLDYWDANVWAAYALKGADPHYAACCPLFDDLYNGKRVVVVPALVVGEVVRAIKGRAAKGRKGDAATRITPGRRPPPKRPARACRMRRTVLPPLPSIAAPGAPGPTPATGDACREAAGPPATRSVWRRRGRAPPQPAVEQSAPPVRPNAHDAPAAPCTRRAAARRRQGCECGAVAAVARPLARDPPARVWEGGFDASIAPWSPGQFSTGISASASRQYLDMPGSSLSAVSMGPTRTVDRRT